MTSESEVSRASRPKPGDSDIFDAIIVGGNNREDSLFRERTQRWREPCQ